MRSIFILVLISIIQVIALGKDRVPVRGFCISAPAYDKIDQFVEFFDKELGRNEKDGQGLPEE